MRDRLELLHLFLMLLNTVLDLLQRLSEWWSNML